MQYVCCYVLRLNLYLAGGHLILELGTLYRKEQSHLFGRLPSSLTFGVDDRRLKDGIVPWNPSFLFPWSISTKPGVKMNQGIIFPE